MQELTVLDNPRRPKIARHGALMANFLDATFQFSVYRGGCSPCRVLFVHPRMQDSTSCQTQRCWVCTPIQQMRLEDNFDIP